MISIKVEKWGRATIANSDFLIMEISFIEKRIQQYYYIPDNFLNRSQFLLFKANIQINQKNADLCKLLS